MNSAGDGRRGKPSPMVVEERSRDSTSQPKAANSILPTSWFSWCILLLFWPLHIGIAVFVALSLWPTEANGQLQLPLRLVGGLAAAALSFTAIWGLLKVAARGKGALRLAKKPWAPFVLAGLAVLAVATRSSLNVQGFSFDDAVLAGIPTAVFAVILATALYAEQRDRASKSRHHAGS
ncbi:MAG: hypothetical protein U0132_23835 [Gemmatimonadaceae bacterium]